MGNELGHIFKLGYKYSGSMNVRYLDENGKSQMPSMGCYGIGIDRTLASVIEEHHDESGIIWPLSIAPYHVIIIPIKYSGKIKDAADKLNTELENAGIEVLLDDRDERIGVKLKDMELIGITSRVVIGKALSEGKVEFRLRAAQDNELFPLDTAALKIIERLQA